MDGSWRDSGLRGTGLGLAIAHSIVTHAGGSISLKSAAGTGTEAHVAFPQKDE